MEYITLGNTGLKVSRLGFGGIPIQRISKEEAAVLLRKLPEYGVNYIDTARGYTVSEEYIGAGIEGIRDKFVLATKSMARTKEAMAADIDISLKNLRTNYIDLYQLHFVQPKDFDTIIGPEAHWKLYWKQRPQERFTTLASLPMSLVYSKKRWNRIG